jgi:hypothetical protein
MSVETPKRMSTRAIVLGSAAAAYLVVVGFVGGIVVERMRFDAHRQVAVKRLDAEKERLRARAIALEQAIGLQRGRAAVR